MENTLDARWAAKIPLLAVLFAFVQFPDQLPIHFQLSSVRIYTPGETAAFRLDATNVSDAIRFRVFKATNPVGFFASQYTSLPQITSDLSPVQHKGWEKVISMYPLMREWEERVKLRRNQWISQDIPLGVNQSGVYVVEGRAHGKVGYAVVVVSPIALVTKLSKSQVLTYVVDRKTSTAIGGVKVYVFRNKEKLAEGESDKSGVFLTSIPAIEGAADGVMRGQDMIRPGPVWHQQVLVMAQRGDEFVLANPSMHWFEDGGDHRIYVYTERPVYRPSQEVFFKGIVRINTPQSRLAPSRNAWVAVRIRDARGTEIYTDSLQTNENGTFNGSITLADGAPLGMYHIETSLQGSSNTIGFEVQEYKKPEYEVTVTTGRDRYAKGEIIHAAVKAMYYFGSPVTGADVEYRVYRSRYWRPWWAGTEYAWFYESNAEFSPSYQEMLFTGGGKLNAEGELSITIPTDKSAHMDYVYRIEANVTDASRRTIIGSTKAEVTRGLFSMTVRSEKHVFRRGDEIPVRISILDFDGNGVQAAYVARVSREWWLRIPRVENGRTTYDYKHHSDAVMAVTGKTGENSQSTALVSLSDLGFYTISVSADDALGNTVQEAVSVYVADENFVWQSHINQGIQIIPDKESYEVGETVRALVILPASNIDVLITSEADHVIDYRVERFKGSAATSTRIISIPLRESHSPNFYLGVNALAGDQFHHSAKQIAVLPREKFLKVEIIPDKDSYKPGETGLVTVKVTDKRGRPVRNAELSLGIVDESIYAIASERVPDIRTFFYANRLNRVATWSSLYYRSYGYFDEVMAADASTGRTAAKSVGIVEEPPLSDLGRRQFAEAVLRKDFRDLMHWSPTLLTNEKGLVRGAVKFPDNLTTWRATVRVVTGDTKVGNEVAKIVVRKNLLIRMETPRFLTQRDSTTIATIIHNYLNEDKHVRVNLRAYGLELHGKPETVLVPKNDHVRIDWKIAANESGTATLTATALTDEESDAMELTLPILPHGIYLTQAQVIDLDETTDAKTLLLTIPHEADMKTATIAVQLSASLASTILTALDDLVGYPYGCVEQTMSRFLPTIIVANTLRDLNAPFDVSLKDELPKMVEKGLQRLYALQHQDGGWGWWENDNTDAVMTSYVVYGLTLARLAGYSVTDDAFRRGVQRIETLLNSSVKLDPTTHAYAIYVLSFAGANGIRMDAALLKSQLAALNIVNANNYTRSLVALASYHQGDEATAGSAARVLEGAATRTGTAAFWSGKAWQYNWQDDHVETTAFALKALLAARGNSELVQQAVHWLLKQRRGGSWLSTKQTAIVIFALVDYLKTSKELQPNYTATLAVNGSEVHQHRMTKEMLFDKEPKIEIKGDRLKKGINTLRIHKAGEGKLYVTARVGYYSEEENIDAQKAGFAVTRDYFKLVRVKRDNHYVYEKRSVRGPIRPGDELFVKITLSTDGHYEYFMLEDPLPSGVEVVADEGRYTISGEKEYEHGPSFYGWRYWWAGREVRDEKVAFFARQIQAGTYTFSYIVRAQIPGRYHVMPAVGSLMYYPEVRGNSDERELVIAE